MHGVLSGGEHTATGGGRVLLVDLVRGRGRGRVGVRARAGVGVGVGVRVRVRARVNAGGPRLPAVTAGSR